MVSNEIQATARREKKTAQSWILQHQEPCKMWKSLHALSMAEAIRIKRGKYTFYQTDVNDMLPNVGYLESVI